MLRLRRLVCLRVCQSQTYGNPSHSYSTLIPHGAWRMSLLECGTLNREMRVLIPPTQIHLLHIAQVSWDASSISEKDGSNPKEAHVPILFLG